MQNNNKVAYFSMETGLDVGLPTYSGGLGILAGGPLRTAADLKNPSGGGHTAASPGIFPSETGRERTSGMKAALNDVLSLSILDGWWIEGCIEGVTGWAIGEDHRLTEAHDDRSRDAAVLYDKLEHVIPHVLTPE